jgi:hypothetical protein
MTNPAGVTRAHVGHLLLCALAVFGLAACGDDDVANSAAASSSNGSVISTRLGMINRDPKSDPSIAPGLQAPTPPAPETPLAPPKQQHPGVPPIKIVDGSVTLDWTPPTQNNDGTTLSNLAGYTVYYGTSPSHLTQSVKLTNPGLTAYTVGSLAAGTWYFSVSSYSSSGLESTRTAVISTTI